MSEPRLEIGITPWEGFERGGADALCAQAERAERLGFHSFWLPEGHFSGAAAIPQPLLWHAAIAARTTRLRLGTTSYLLPIRHPLQVAEEVAVLDRLSGGRVILGVGRGFRKALFAAFEVDRSTKRDRFESALTAMRNAWAGHPVAPESDDQPGAPALLAPRPIQDPHPPIWVAAFGPKALEQAGRLGLPYLASPLETEATLLANYAMHRETLAQHGHEPVDLAVPIMRTVFAHADAAVVSRVRDALQRQALALSRSALAVLRRSGSAEAEDFAILGEPERVRDEVLRFAEELGMTHLIARTQVPGTDEHERLAALDALASLGFAA
jgi:alkanesulfonate monooxygenase SsuD/methylene tetrahydromethanopterin reductase-like flavin-dependent oxidoreductase (luciferase family)